MKLYLASYAMNTIDKILENEGSDFTGEKAIFIPTAGDLYDNKDFIEADKKALEDHGANVVEMDIKDKDEAEIRTLPPI